MINNGSFTAFVLKERRWMLWGTVGLLVIHFVVLKLLFPHVISVVDSWFYIRGADENIDVDLRPIGYSWLLRLIHFFNHHDMAVVLVQYILLEAAILYFYFTAMYFLRPVRWIEILILFCLIMNPLLLCIGNYILSEGVFTALTVFWFTITLWFCFRPRARWVYLMVILVFISFTMRYHSIFYPLISIPVILFSKINWRMKFAGLLLGCLLFGGFIQYTKTQYGKLTGQREFSPFSGWQLAGNALLMYRHLPNRSADLPPTYLRPLHGLVLQHLDTAASPDSVPDHLLSIYYMWDTRSPLQLYMDWQFQYDTSSSELKRWASMGRLYNDYGNFLIKKHPMAYLRYYVAQGTDWFVYPKLEISNTFDTGGYRVTDRIKRWFDYPSNWVTCTSSKVYTIAAFPPIVTLLNLLLVLSTIGFYFCRADKEVSPMFNRAVILNSFYWVLNFCLMVTLAATTLRYMLPILIFDLVFVPVMMERIYSLLKVPASPVASPGSVARTARDASLRSS